MVLQNGCGGNVLITDGIQSVKKQLVVSFQFRLGGVFGMLKFFLSMSAAILYSDLHSMLYLVDHISITSSHYPTLPLHMKW